MEKVHRIFRRDDVMAVMNAMRDTILTRYPSMTAIEALDQMVMAVAMYGAEIVRLQANPVDLAEAYGEALTDSIMLAIETRERTAHIVK